ncbi:3-oxoacyl-[acyl-carrier protein] reductase [Erythromicrobium ramosum]|uniref:3-oxoacyl-[acyl-carrier protein] reductase n=1 Tax=Erythrobacter ramosus TaxID=35811 RepID=A0A6I4UMK4_9SPHN|nr:SDR family oxidoreductase [Erythrobacter ramosus]MBB3777163.1 3-oxoacyl-[acyl-carrier protein] reductase [Erythrobacter ramosus]MXP39918.1 SDR family oxidoreductase [Erythrobacter ramosus]
MDLQLDGKTALVLGASKGLGRAIAVSLADEGADVITVARSADGPHGLAHIVADLDDPAAPAQIIARVRDTGKPVDILVLNAGGPPTGAAATTTPGDFAAVLDRMFNAQLKLAQAFLPEMRARGFGRILAVASTSLITPIPGLVLSNAVRAMLASWCKTLAAEVAAEGVTVNLLLPGQIATDRLTSLHGAMAAGSGMSHEQITARSIAAIPAGRLGRPEEFGDMAAFLASPRASFITGCAIKVDGGQTATL